MSTNPEPSSALKTAALDYARMGWHVVPLHHTRNGSCSCGDPECSSPGKHPVTRNGLNAATSDPDDVDFFWDQYPQANIGIVAGPSNLAIVDLDSKEAVQAWKQLGLNQPTRYVKTGKGMHLYYHDPTQAGRPSVGDGIDLRAGPSYVVAPPSQHANGKTYQWANPEAPITQVPMEVLAFFASRKRQQAASIANGEPIPQGMRNTTLVSLAGSARRRGHTELEILSLLRATNDERVDPPMDDRDLRRIAASAAKWEPGMPELNDAIHWGTIRVEHDSQPTETAVMGDSWLAQDLLDRAKNPPHPPSIGGAVYAGKRHVLSGEPESGKSWLALAWCAECIERGSPVVYIDHEMGPSMTLERLRLLGVEDDQLDLFRYVEPTEPAQLAYNQIQALVDGVELVIIDSTIGSLSLHSLDPNSGADIEAWYQRVVDVLRRDSGAAVVALDHVTKDPDGRGKYAIGSERKIGAADVHLSAEVIQDFGRGRDGKARVRTRKDRPGHLPRPVLGTFTLAASNPLPGIPVYTWDATTDGHTEPIDCMQQIVTWLRDNGKASKSRIARGLSEDGHGYRKETVWKAIRLLEERQIITSTPRGNQEVVELSTNQFPTVPTPPGTVPPPSPYRGMRTDPPSVPSSNTPGTDNPPPGQVPASRGLAPPPAGTIHNGEPLNPPCPQCSSTLAIEAYTIAGLTYCCRDCSRGDVCACKYLKEEQ